MSGSATTGSLWSSAPPAPLLERFPLGGVGNAKPGICQRKFTTEHGVAEFAANAAGLLFGLLRLRREKDFVSSVAKLAFRAGDYSIRPGCALGQADGAPRPILV